MIEITKHARGMFVGVFVFRWVLILVPDVSVVVVFKRVVVIEFVARASDQNAFGRVGMPLGEGFVLVERVE